MVGDEKRRHSRLPVFLDCELGGASALMRISDFSTSGCFVDTRTPIQVGTPVTVAVRLAGSPLTLPGRVIHVQAGIGFGMQFDALPAESREAITRYLEGLENPPH
jgi:PilZ domain-containing protein